MSAATDAMALGEELFRLRKRIERIERSNQLSRGSIVGRSLDVYNADEDVYFTIGEQYDGTVTTNPITGPVPPIPTAPEVLPGLRSFTVRWDGLYEATYVEDEVGDLTVYDDAVVAPLDFTRVEIHASPDPNFTAEFSDTIVGTFDSPRGGDRIIPVEVLGANTVKLVTRTQSGKRSEASVGTTAQPDLVRDTDLSQQVRDTLAEGAAAIDYALASVRVWRQPNQPTADPARPFIVGDTWYDTDDNMRLYVWNGSAFTDTRDTTIAAAQAAAVAAQTAATNAAADAAAAILASANVVRDPGFETDYRDASLNSRFTRVTSPVDTGTYSLQVVSGAAAVTQRIVTVPVLPGQTWRARARYSTTADFNGTLGGSKVRIGTPQVASAPFPTSTAWSTVEVIYTVPASGITELDLAINANQTVGTLWVEWVEFENITMAYSATQSAAAAMSYAQTRNKVFRQTTMPTSAQGPFTLGDVWYDTDDGFRVYVYDGSTFTDARDTGIAAAAAAAADAQSSANTALTNAAAAMNYAQTRNKVFRQTTMPTAGQGPFTVGDVWYDTDDGFRIYLYDGTTFTDARDTGIAAAATAAANAQSSANTALTNAASAMTYAQSRSKVFRQTTTPTAGQGPFAVGDVWYDTDDGFRVYVYDGTSFVDARDTGIAAAATAAANAQSSANTALTNAAAANTAASNAQSTANSAQTAAQQGISDAAAAQSAANTAQSTANTAQTNAAAAQTAAQNAQNTANAAQTSANGKNIVFRQSTAPSTSGRVVGDTWFDTANNNRVSVWDGTAWALTTFGVAAITDSAVTQAKIADAAVVTAKIADAQVITQKIADTAVTGQKIADLAVGTAKIDALAVTQAKIANLAVGNAQIADLAVTSVKVADAAIVNAKIGDLAVDTAKIANLAVTNAKIADLAVTNAKIADATIQNAKIANLDAAKITTGILDANRIGARSITTAMLSVVGENRANDPGFESGVLTNHSVPTNANLTQTVTSTTTDVLQGTYAAQWTATAANAPNFTALISNGVASSLTAPHPNTAPGETVHFGAWVWVSSGATAQVRAQLLVRSRNDSATNVASANGAFQAIGGQGWRYISTDLLIPTSTTATNLYYFGTLQFSTVAAGDVIRVDNLMLRPRLAGSLIVDGTITTANLSATAIDGMTVTGATLQTSATAARGVKMTSTGLTAYDATGVATLAISGSTGSISMLGALTSGSTVTGATVTGGTLQTESTVARGIKINSTGMTVYDGAGAPTMTVTAATGAIAMKGDLQTGSTITGAALSGGTVTGALVQTETTAARGVKMSTSGLFGYDAAGVTKFSLSTAGALSVAGAITSGSTIDGAIVTGGTVQTEATAARGIKINSTGLTAYDGAGVPTFTITAATGAVAMKGDLQTGSTITGAALSGGTVTGALVQTETTAARGVKMSTAGLFGYDTAGVTKFSLSTAGVLAVTGAITGSTMDSSVVTGGTLQTEATAARGIKVNSTGLTAYDAAGTPTLTITAATGAIAMKGDLQTGSTITGAAVSGGTVTGALVQTETTAARGVKMSTSGLFGYDTAGVTKFSLTTAGVFTVSGAISSGATIDSAVITGGTIQTETTAARGVKINSAGLTAYNSGGGATLTVVASSGQVTLVGPLLSGGTITGPTLQTEATAARGVKITTGGLTAYNASGTATATIDASTGAVTFIGPVLSGGTITGPTLQTEATAARGIKMDTTGLYGYSTTGVPRFSLTTAGALSVTGAITSGSTIDGAVVTGGTLQTEATAARGIKINSTGMTAYNTSGQQTLTLTAAGALTTYNPNTGAPTLTVSATDGSITMLGNLTTGSTIVGATIRTAASGNRVEMVQDASAGAIKGWSGYSSHTLYPGQLNFSYDAQLGNVKTLLTSGRADSMEASKEAYIELRSGYGIGGNASIYTSNKIIAENDQILGGPLGNSTTEVTGLMKAARVKVALGRTLECLDSGSRSGDPDTAGATQGWITCQHDLNLVGVYQVYLQSRANGGVRHFTVMEKNANNFKFRVNNEAGAVVTAANIGYDYWIVG